MRGSVEILGREIAGAPEVGIELLNARPMRVCCGRTPAEGETNGNERGPRLRCNASAVRI